MRVVLYGVLAFAIWAMLTIPYYVCNVMEFCDDSKKNTQIVTPAEPNTAEEEDQLPKDPGNLVFNWESDLPITNNDFELVKDSLSQGLQDSTRELMVVGKYFNDEENTSTYENLGLARANAVKSLLEKAGIKSKIAVSSALAGDSLENQEQPFLGVDLRYNELASEVSDFTITEEEGKIVINFPVASADPTLNTVLDERMTQLAERVNENDGSVEISGHTDNTGSTAQNYNYGLARANAIKALLISKSVAPEKIKVESKGETMPIADNSTDEGKRKNRRVEIIIK